MFLLNLSLNSGCRKRIPLAVFIDGKKEKTLFGKKFERKNVLAKVRPIGYFSISDSRKFIY